MDTTQDACYMPTREKGRRRKRTTPEELAVLERCFDETPLPSTQKRQELAKALHMDPRSVQIWFQNRRQKEKAKQTETVHVKPARRTGKENINPLHQEAFLQYAMPEDTDAPRPAMQRTQSGPAAFLSSAPIRQAALSRRSRSSATVPTAEPVPPDELLKRLPMDSSSPVKSFRPAPRRVTSFTLEDAADATAVFWPTQDALGLQGGAFSMRPNRKASARAQPFAPYPSKEQLAQRRAKVQLEPIRTDKHHKPLAGMLSIADLLEAARCLDESDSPSSASLTDDVESDESETDDELAQMARVRGGDGSFSSIGSADDSHHGGGGGGGKAEFDFADVVALALEQQS